MSGTGVNNDELSAIRVSVHATARCWRKNRKANLAGAHLTALRFSTSDGRALTCADDDTGWYGPKTDVSSANFKYHLVYAGAHCSHYSGTRL